MSSRIAAFLTATALLIGSLAAADDPKPGQPEPPVRLKKKDRPKVAPEPEKRPEPPKKDETKKKDDKEEPGDVDQGEDPRQVLERLSKNMKESADRLAKTDPGDATRQVQRDIIKDLDALLNQQNQHQQQQQGGSSNDQQQKADKKDQKNGQRGQKRMARRQSRRRRQQARGNQSRPQNEPRDSQANKSTTSGQGAGGKKNLADRRPDTYKDIWGHLPESLRMQMDAYGREKFMAKYDELLKQYYATIAEKERR